MLKTSFSIHVKCVMCAICIACFSHEFDAKMHPNIENKINFDWIVFVWKSREMPVAFHFLESPKSTNKLFFFIKFVYQQTKAIELPNHHLSLVGSDATSCLTTTDTVYINFLDKLKIQKLTKIIEIFFFFFTLKAS